MLVMSREVGQSIMIGDEWVVTLLGVRGNGETSAAKLVASRTTSNPRKPDETLTAKIRSDHALRADHAFRIGGDIKVYLIDALGDKARLAVVAPTTFAVHRLEVLEAIRRGQRDARRARGFDDLDDGLSGSPVVRPPPPKPPTLGAELDEPHADGDQDR